MTISLINKLPMTLNLQPYLIGFFIRQPRPRSDLNYQLSLLLLIDLSLMYNYTKGDVWLKQSSKRLADTACRCPHYADNIFLIQLSTFRAQIKWQTSKFFHYDNIDTDMFC